MTHSRPKSLGSQVGAVPEEVIAQVYASGSTELYTLDATPMTCKVAANLMYSSSWSIDINVLHR